MGVGRVPVAHDNKVLVICATTSKLEDRWGIYLEEDESPDGYMVDLYVDRNDNIYWPDWVVLNTDLGYFEKNDVDRNLPAVRKITEDVGDWRAGLLYFVAEVDKQTMDIRFLKYKLSAFDSFGIMEVRSDFSDDELASLLPMDEILEEVRLNM